MGSCRLIGTIETSGLRTLSCALMIAMGAPPGPALALEQEVASPEASPATAAQASWPVEFARGDLPFVAPHRNLTLEQRDGAFLIREGKEMLRGIPAGALVGVVYDVASYRPVVGYYRSASPGTAPQGPGGALWFGLTVVVIPLLLAPFVKSQHFVTLIWRDRDQIRDVTLQVKGSDHGGMLAAIQAVTGVVWRDAPTERARLRDDLKTAKGPSFILHLDSEIYIADTYVDAGSHRAVILDRGPGGAEMIVFEGHSLDDKEVVLAIPVRVTAAETVAGEEAAVSYGESPAGSTIKEVRAGNQVITLPEFIEPAPGEPQAVPGSDGRVVQIDAGQLATGTIVRTEYDGQPAFHFQAMRTNFKFSFSNANPFPVADLYVTHDRVIFDAGESEAAGKRRVSLTKSAIIEMAPGLTGDAATIRLTTSSQTYSFRLRAPGRSPKSASPMARYNSRIRLVETRLADFARLAIRDFDAAMKMFDGWVAGTPPE